MKNFEDSIRNMIQQKSSTTTYGSLHKLIQFYQNFEDGTGANAAMVAAKIKGNSFDSNTDFVNETNWDAASEKILLVLTDGESNDKAKDFDAKHSSDGGGTRQCLRGYMARGWATGGVPS